METCGVKKPEATDEFNATISRIFSYAAWADKFDGAAHDAPYRGVTLALPEPIGIIGLVAPDNQPLLSAISLIAPAIAMGNRVVYIPGERYQNIILELVSVMETSDIPGGVINIVTGDKSELSKQLAGHGEVESIWCWGDAEITKSIETISIENLKRTWCNENNDRDWLDLKSGEGTEFLRKATHVKNIWTPYGD
jgi:aldehyde dehydrogenase (NAD+)